LLRDPDEVDEVLQTALVIAWERLPQLRDAQRLDSWFFRVCQSVAARRLKSARDLVNVDLDQLPTEDRDDYDAVEDLLAFDRQVWSICRLPRQQRAVLISRLYRGLSVAETATLLRKRPGTVKATLNQAIGRLRRARR
jgi:RNA polymerase sigma-70 factor (ECF subfamily)